MLKTGCCFEKDIIDIMDHCQMGDVLSSEVQIISYYLDLTAGEVGEDGERISSTYSTYDRIHFPNFLQY